MSHQPQQGGAPGPHGEAPKPLVPQGSGVVPVHEAPPANYPGLQVDGGAGARSVTAPNIVPHASHGGAAGPHGQPAKPLVSQSSAPTPAVEAFTAVPQLTSAEDRAPTTTLPSDSQTRAVESESAQDKAEDSDAWDNLNSSQQKQLVKVMEEADKARQLMREKTGSPLVNLHLDVQNFAQKAPNVDDKKRQKVIDDFLNQMAHHDSPIWQAIYQPLKSLSATEAGGWVKSIQSVVFRFAPLDNESPSFVLASGVTLQYVLNDHAWVSLDKGTVFTVEDWSPALVEKLVKKAAPELRELVWIELWNPKTKATEKVKGSLQSDLDARLPPNGDLTYAPTK